MFDREAREDVDRVGDDEDDCFALQVRVAQRVQDLLEQLDVPVDQIEPALVGLAAKASGDANQIRVGGAVVAAIVDLLIAGDGGAVQQIERLALRHLLVGVEEMNLRDDRGALESESSIAAHASAAADDADFHGSGS